MRYFHGLQIKIWIGLFPVGGRYRLPKAFIKSQQNVLMDRQTIAAASRRAQSLLSNRRMRFADSSARLRVLYCARQRD